MKEIWKDIEGYEGLYQVSTKGRVKSLERKTLTKTGILLKTEEHILDGNIDRYGYCRVHLFNQNCDKTFLVHRLVAKAFIPNPLNLPSINHKNEIKTDNCVENLEWCTVKYNDNYGNRNKRMSATQRKRRPLFNRPVIQYSLDGKEIARYDSAYYAAKVTGVLAGSITSVCRGRFSQTGGYRWKYVDP